MIQYCRENGNDRWRNYHGNGNGTVKVKVKAFPYSIPSVGPGADPGVQAVSRR